MEGISFVYTWRDDASWRRHRRCAAVGRRTVGELRETDIGTVEVHWGPVQEQVSEWKRKSIRPSLEGYVRHS